MAEIGSLEVSLSLNANNWNQSISQVNRQMKAMGGELQALKGKGSEYEKSVEGLAKKQDILQRSFDASSIKLQEQRKRYDELVASGKASDAQIERAAIAVNKAQTEYNKLERELADVTKELKTQSSAWTQSGKDLETAGAKIKSTGSVMTGIGKELSMKVTAPIVALGVASAKTAIDFEAQMDRVGAIASATAEEMEKLTETALALGASTSKSASEVAIGMENMAAMGFNANQIMSAMPGIISAAEASGSDMAQTADVVAAALNSFGLEASEASRVADVLAQTANQSAADITDLQYAFKYAAPVANTLGISIEQLAASVGIMSENGMKGEQAGTTLRAALLRLTSDTDSVTGTLDELGITIANSEGKMLSFSDIIKQLGDATKDMGNAQKASVLSTIFGTEAVTGMLSIIEAGPEKLNELTKGLENSAGASAETAAKMKDNLKGALEELGGTIETAAIKIGNLLEPAIRKVIEVVQSLVEKFNNLSPIVQTTILAVAGIAAAIGPVLIVGGALVASIGAIVSAFGAISLAIAEAGGIMALLSAKIGAIGSAFTVLTGPIGIAIGAIALIGAALTLAWKQSDEFRNAVTAIFEKVKSTVMTVFNTVSSFLIEQFNKIKGQWDSVGPQFGEAVANVFNGIMAVINFVMPAVEFIVKTVWTAIKQIISGALDVIMGAVKLFSGIFTGDFSKMWEGIKQIFSGAINAVIGFMTVTLVGGIRTLLVNLSKFGLSIIKGMWTNIINYLKGVKLVQVGKDIIQGLINGISNMKKAVIDKVKEIATSIGDGIKTFFKIQSPSRLMMVLGGYIGEGLAIGIDSTKQRNAQAMKEIGKVLVDVTKANQAEVAKIADAAEKERTKILAESAKKRAEVERNSGETIAVIHASANKKTGKLSASQSTRIQNIHKDTASKLAKIEEDSKEKLSKIQEKAWSDMTKKQEKVDSEKLEAVKSFLDNKRGLEQLSLVEEALIWEESLKHFKDGTDAKIKAQLEYRDALNAVNDEIVSINETYSSKIVEVNEDLKKREEELTDTYTKAVDERAKSLTNFTGLFEEFDIKFATSGSKLTKNLESQVEGFKTWQKEIEELSKKAIDEGLLEELRTMGPDALAEVMALNDMTNEELTHYSDLYKEKALLARQQAVSELAPMKQEVDAKLIELRQQSSIRLTELQAEWKSKIQGITKETEDGFSSMRDIGVNAMQGLSNGLEFMEPALKKQAKRIADDIRRTIEKALDIKSPSRVMKGIGVFIGQGLIDGMDATVNKVSQASSRLADSVTNTPFSVPEPNLINIPSNPSTQYGDIYVTIPARDIQEFTSVIDFFNRLPQAKRRM